MVGPAPGRRAVAVSDPYGDAASALRHYWRHDPDGRPVIPVDPIQIARSLGIDVYSSELRHGTSGVLVKQDGGIPIIHVNVRDALVRQRFSCAHEIGHYWRKGVAEQNFGYVDKRDVLARAGTDPEEIYANAVAHELLMPRQTVIELYQRGASAEEQAAELAVSLEAMRIRFDTLGLG